MLHGWPKVNFRIHFDRNIIISRNRPRRLKVKFTRPLLQTCGIVIIAISAIAAFALSHGAHNDNHKTTLTWMLSNDAVNKPMLEELVRIFEQAHPAIRVDIMWVAGGQYHTKLKTLSAAGQAPDVFWCSDVFAPYMLSSLADITSYVEGDSAEMELADFYPQLIEGCRHQGRYYYMPRYFTVDLLYYNKNLFDKAGLPYPTRQWTWDDYIKAAKTLTLKDASGKVTQWGSNIAGGWWGEWGIFVEQAGGTFFTPDLARCTLDTPEAVKGLTFYRDKIYRYKVSPPPGYGPIPPEFASGIVAMDYGGHAALWVVYRKIEGLHWDIQVLPRGPKAQGGEYAIDAMGIAKTSRHKDEAWEFLKFLVSKESIRRHAQQGYLPVRKSIAKETVLAGKPGERPQDPQHTEIVYEALELGRTLPRQPDFVEIMLKVIQPEIDLMLLDKQTPAMTARRASEAVNTFIPTLGKDIKQN